MLGYIRSIVKDLNRTIYVGDRLESNMRALTFVSVVSTLLGVIMVIVNFSSGILLVGASIATVIAGAGCAYCAHVLKNRELTILFPTIFCAFFITLYVVTGSAKGSSVLWALLIPIGMCYFVGVKYGILLSAYFTVLIAIVFYSPLNKNISEYYTPEFMNRFPLLYAAVSVFTGMAMIQYHRIALLEIDHATRLTEEVEKQTAVVRDQSRKIEQMSRQTIHTLANAIDAKDPYKKGHSTRVSLYSGKMAEELGWESERTDDLKYAALLHDIGKIGVPDSILNNPRTLTDIETEMIRSHTMIGRDMLKDRTVVQIADDVAASHHERYDGKGYPSHLAGEDISEEARIVAIADAFDAMNSDRVYRRALGPERIRKELTDEKGGQFDPAFTDLFIKLWDSGEFDEIMKIDPVENDEDIEASSTLLQEVVETFVSQGSKDEIDITTGIMSRNAGEKAIARVMQEEKGCLVFMDVDNLKRINDTYGHEAGDRILHIMGDTLTENSSGSLCCRLGGDEFLLFMKNVSEQEAGDGMTAIIRDFEENKKDDPEIAIASISAGMVMSTPEDTYTDVYNRADKALYHVKQNGKSGFDFYNEESGNTESADIDVAKLVNSIRNSGSYNGAMNVDYREFAKLYEFISNLEERFRYSFKLIVISLEASGDEAFGADELERSMNNMEQSIRQTIRDVDVLTRYSKQQFLVILLGTDTEGVRSAVDRIFRGYFKMNGSGSLVPRYSVADFADPL
ncbi:MAG: diguanylate cyclase [Lachnospiraceae bacterium]|nr:diguanylate cyclase [Lachnospiraceae bacterium]